MDLLCNSLSILQEVRELDIAPHRFTRDGMSKCKVCDFKFGVVEREGNEGSENE